ncbi:spindle pole body interacting protein [Durotheca rogersii]|uniref:spindle pole body interacting protein n=1 Tax=Durotheca rogersii TaxID=419775 RepID=UPI0022201C92|nr:spindle pole body interacting protein [Durotheca rogersii]KAI5864503.1 spindle pole body interacting protein [Durotheca rogersii]
MASAQMAFPYLSRTNTSQSLSNGTAGHHRSSLTSFLSSRSVSQMSHSSRPPRSPQPPTVDVDRTSDPSSKSKTSSLGSRTAASSQHSSLSAPKRPPNPNAQSSRKLRSQYPRESTENHVEYILVASFDIDRGPVMEHQYPVAITGDEHMLAELMLPDQAHSRTQDWTIFFLHKDTSQEEDDEERKDKDERRRRRKEKREKAAKNANDGDDTNDEGSKDEDDEDDDLDDSDSSTDSEPEGGEGPPLIYVLNLVYTKHDKSVKRGAVVKAMAICTRHPFLHIYKPLLLLALEEYYKSPVPGTLALLYEAVNNMDLSLMPRLSLLERHLLQASNNADLFVEKFERMIEMRIAEDKSEGVTASEPLDASKSPPRSQGISRAGTKAHVEGQSAYSVPRDTHEFESRVMYKGIPIPVKIPTAIMPETVGDFSLIKLIQIFSDQKAIQQFPIQHPHLTTSGAGTHPIIVLANALLTQKRIIFVGHNMPSGEVAEAVLAACALASGGILQGFTRHAFPYTDLTKVDDLLKVPGFIAGVTNPTFENHPEWWDLLCDLASGKMTISSKIESAQITEGLVYFQQQNPNFANMVGSSSHAVTDPTGDMVFMNDIIKSITARRGERVIRAKWRDWVVKFTRIAAAFEESVYGASALYIGGDEYETVTGGHGYVWPDENAKQKELAGNVCRIEGWRNTRSYYSYIQDLAKLYTVRPLKGLDLHHMHDRLRSQRLSPSQSREVYLALAKYVHSYDEINLLLSVAPESHAGLFYIALGLFHKDREVRLRVSELVERISEHEAGQHWWKGMSRFEKLAFHRIRREADAEAKNKLEKDGSIAGPGPSAEKRIS